VKFDRVYFERCERRDEETDKQTDKPTDTLTAMLRTPIFGDEVMRLVIF